MADIYVDKAGDNVEELNIMMPWLVGHKSKQALRFNPLWTRYLLVSTYYLHVNGEA